MTLDRLAAGLARGFAYLAGAILLALMGLTVVKVVMDGAGGLFGGGQGTTLVSGYEELVRNFIAVAAFSMLPWCQHARGHVAVDFFVERAPRWLHVLIEAASLLLFAGFAGLVLGFMALYLPELRAGNFTTGQILGWPAWPFYLPALAALASWLLVLAAQALALVRHGPAGPGHG
ncbi:MAG: TRAP transporter small permease [Alphaproteobacteria bacterium]